jgi:beta-lactamase superfamily II metal-dependent hydrolase
MKYILSFFVAWSFVLAARSQRLEIHHIGVGDGDATLVIGIDVTKTGFMDTVTLLIDGQRSSRAGQEIWRYVQDSLKVLTPNRKKLDFLVLSHLHIDHYGGLISFIENLQDANWKIDYVIDRDGAGPTSKINWGLDSSFKYICVDDDVDLPTFTRTARRYLSLANDYNHSTVFAGQDLFVGKNFTNLSMFCLASTGAALGKTPTGYEPTMFIRYNGNTGYYIPYNENDLSLVFNLGFKTFNYFLGGDIGGGRPYADGETPIANFLASYFGQGKFHYCGIKVSHHGSAHSTNDNFLKGVTPTMAVIPACLRTYSGTALPTQSTINALGNSSVKNNIKFCFEPYNPGTPASYWTPRNMQYYQDVSIKILSLPVAGQDINMQIITRRRRTDNYAYIEGPQISTITCTQAHTSSFK